MPAPRSTFLTNVVHWRLAQTEKLVMTLLIASTCLTFFGCDLPDRPPLQSLQPQRSSSTPTQATSEELTDSRPPSLAIDPSWETWDVYYVAGRPVGYNHVVSEPSDLGDEVVHSLDNVLFVTQGRARTLQRLRQTSRETVGGELLSFDATLSVGPMLRSMSGEIASKPNGDPELRLTTIRGVDRKTRRSTWKPGYRGLIAIEESLRDTPMTEKGMQRQFKMLLPGHYIVVTARLRCSGEAVVPMNDNSMQKLIEINYQIEFPEGGTTDSTIWTDSDGTIVRTYAAGIDMVSYRTDAETALSVARQVGRSVLMPVEGTIEKPDEVRRVAYQVDLSAKAAALSEQEFYLKPSVRQFVRRRGDALQVLVSTEDEAALKGFESSELEATPADSEISRLVNHNHSLVRRMAGATLSRQSSLSDKEMVFELLQTTNNIIEYDPEQFGLISAGDVAEAGKAGYIGRAIFYAALLRAKEIPARFAVGLRYQPSTEPDGKPTLVDDVWVLAKTQSGWIPIDVESAREAGADRLILATTTLSNRDAGEALEPLLKMPGQLSVKVLRAQR